MREKSLLKKSLMLKRGLTALIFVLLATTSLNAQIFVEAENFIRMSGVQTEGTSDEGGGANVGWIETGDWMEYNVNIPVTGEYKLSFRVAGKSTAAIKLLSGTTELQTVAITSSGDWQNWITVSANASISLSAGEQTLRLVASTGGFNLNWWKLALTSPTDADVPTTPNILESKTGVHDVYLVWSASTDATSQIAGYEILKDGKYFRYSTDTVLNVSKLAPNRTFNLSIVTTDLAGNKSEPASIEVSTDTLPWEITWRDEFNYTGEVDRSKWNFQTGGDGWGNGEAQYYTDGANAEVVNGELIIEARQENYGSNKFTSTRMNTSGKGDFLYGRIEVRAKLPKTNGTWPAIWTLPTEWIYGGWPDCGEIDIMEHSATSGYGHVFGTIHTGAYNHVEGTQKSGGVNFTDVTNTYHTYAIEWYPDHIDWYYNDEIVFTFANEYKTTAEWPYDIKHHLLLNVAIGGGLGGTINYNGVWPQQMIVDYVRMYDFKLGENDTIAPEPPKNLVAKPKWASIELSWDASKDNYAIDKYYVYVNNEKQDSVSATNILIQELEALTEYTVGVQAIDVAGNLSTMVSTTVTTTDITGIAIPGKIEAENFTNMSGVDTETCTDAGGGLNLGWIDSGDWMTYTIDVKEAIEFKAAFRVAGQGATGSVKVSDEKGDEITTLSIPVSGGWQAWKTVVSDVFTIPVGVQTIKLDVVAGGFNMNWIEIKDKDAFVGISSITNKSVLMYPNPLNGSRLMVELPVETEQVNVTITATDGRVLYQREEKASDGKISVEGLNFRSGVYVVTLITESEVYTQTLQIQ